MLRGLFASNARRLAGRDRPGLARVKELARSLLPETAAAEITVSEILCRDPGCPGEETVILLMARGARTRAVKISKAAGDVTEQDLRSALVEAGYEVET